MSTMKRFDFIIQSVYQEILAKLKLHLYYF
jgi:hypothetical protein